MHFRLAIFSSLVGLASAMPFARQSFQTLTTQQISSYSPYTYFASAVKCGTNRVQPWNCGGATLAPPFYPREGRVRCRYVSSDVLVSLCSELRGKSQFRDLRCWRRRKRRTVLYERSPSCELHFFGCLHADTVYRVCWLRPRPRHGHCGTPGNQHITVVCESKVPFGRSWRSRR